MFRILALMSLLAAAGCSFLFDHTEVVEYESGSRFYVRHLPIDSPERTQDMAKNVCDERGQALQFDKELQVYPFDVGYQTYSCIGPSEINDDPAVEADRGSAAGTGNTPAAETGNTLGPRTDVAPGTGTNGVTTGTNDIPAVGTDGG